LLVLLGFAFLILFLVRKSNRLQISPSAFRLKTSFRLTSVSIPVTYLSLELNRRTHTNTALQNSESRHKPPQLYQSYAPLWVQTEENLSSDHFLFLYCRLRMYRGHDAYMKRL
ncbi:hypothetical protein KCU97_g29, partial [Aureobasidium melanogenum]